MWTVPCQPLAEIFTDIFKERKETVSRFYDESLHRELKKYNPFKEEKL